MHTAMILAAGRGERLRPLTDSIPKALCRVNHIPLIEHHVINLAKAGFSHLVINHAHLGGLIRRHLGKGGRFGVDIEYSPEPPGGLETGGGIVNALPLLGNAPFITVNADIFTDYNFAKLRLPKTSLIHLVLIKKPFYLPHADFGLSHELKLQNNSREYTFPGIAVYHPQVFSHLKIGRYSVVPLMRETAEQQQATGEIFSGKWFDIGTEERLTLANREVCQKNS
jgi:MurNAc alpha-1-phosphate uridylyltransferase